MSKKKKNETPDTEVLSADEMGVPGEEAVKDADDAAADVKKVAENAADDVEDAVSDTADTADDAVTDVLTRDKKKSKDDAVTDVLTKDKKAADSDDETVPQKMGAKSDARKWAADSKAQDDIKEYQERKKEQEGVKEKGGAVKVFGIIALLIMLAGAAGIGLILAFYVFMPGDPVYKGAAAKGFSTFNIEGYVPKTPEVLPTTPTDAEPEGTATDADKDASKGDADKDTGSDDKTDAGSDSENKNDDGSTEDKGKDVGCAGKEA